MDQQLPQNVEASIPSVETVSIPQEFCSKCKNPVSITDNFCPHCGTQIFRQVSIGKQIWIYFVSIAFPPFGLGWTFKYMKSQHSQVRWVGIIAGVLTIISTIVTTWWTISIFQNANQQLQQQLNGYQNLGL